MQRLTNTTIERFTRGEGARAILFGCPDGRATFDQANEFALLWADHSDEAAFGYIDAIEHRGANEAFGVSLLPTTVLLRDGEIVACVEGRASASVLSSVLFHTTMAIAA